MKQPYLTRADLEQLGFTITPDNATKYVRDGYVLSIALSNLSYGDIGYAMSELEIAFGKSGEFKRPTYLAPKFQRLFSADDVAVVDIATFKELLSNCKG